MLFYNSNPFPWGKLARGGQHYFLSRTCVQVYLQLKSKEFTYVSHLVVVSIVGQCELWSDEQLKHRVSMSFVMNPSKQMVEATYNFLVINDNPAIISDRLDNRRVSNFQTGSLEARLEARLWFTLCFTGIPTSRRISYFIFS